MRAMLLLGRFLLACALALFASAGMASTPPERAAVQAAKLVGAPYRYGGASPKGFDCSGLVQFSYRQAGISLPHNTEQQRRLGKRVRLSELRAGDLIFFDQRGKKNSHVAIYVGRGEIVHAPSSGKRVRRDRLDSPYWRKHVSEARRLSA
jgi:cell wall-associated NlpC family hydrolase